MIQSFADKTTAAIFSGLEVRRLSRELQQRAAEKLAWLNAAHTVDDLRIPRGNRLEKRSGDTEGGGYAIELASGVFASTVNGGFASLAYKPMTTALAHIRAIGIIAHIDAGKTTADECMLFYSGYTHYLG